MHGHFWSHNSQNHFHGFLDKNNRVGKNPYLLEFVETPRFRSLLVALVRGSTFLLAPPKTAGPIVGKLIEKVELLSKALSFFPSPFLSLFPPSLPIPPVGPRWVKLESTCCPCCHPIGSLDSPYHLIHLPWILIQSCVATCLLWVPLELFV